MPGLCETSANQIIVDLADLKVTDNPRAELSTYALGSCVAVAIYDPKAHIGGLLHYMLPDSAINRPKALINPMLFADTAIPLLFHRAYKLGAAKERIVCKLAGASELIGDQQIFNIAQRNQLAAREILDKNSVSIQGEYVGGNSGMSLTLFMNTGRVVATLPNGKELDL